MCAKIYWDSEHRGKWSYLEEKLFWTHLFWETFEISKWKCQANFFGYTCLQFRKVKDLARTNISSVKWGNGISVIDRVPGRGHAIKTWCKIETKYKFIKEKSYYWRRLKYSACWNSKTDLYTMVNLSKITNRLSTYLFTNKRQIWFFKYQYFVHSDLWEMK